MSITNPDINSTDGNLQDKYPTGTVFHLVGGRIVEGVKTQYGDGKMVVLEIRDSDGETRSYSVWGLYLVAQIESIEQGDLPGAFRIEQGPVPGFSQQQDTKKLVPAADGDIPF